MPGKGRREATDFTIEVHYRVNLLYNGRRTQQQPRSGEQAPLWVAAFWGGLPVQGKRQQQF
jgi:hypothetical protein